MEMSSAPEFRIDSYIIHVDEAKCLESIAEIRSEASCSQSFCGEMDPLEGNQDCMKIGQSDG